MECFGQYLNEFPEVHTGVGNVVKDSLVAVTLIFYVADFHVQTQLIGDLSGAYHRVVFPRFRFFVLFEVNGLGDAIDAAYFRVAFQVGLPHLQGNEASGEGDDANVVSRAGFDSNDISFFQGEVVVVVVISFARILELDFHEVGCLVVAGDVGHVVECVELLILASAASGADAA